MTTTKTLMTADELLYMPGDGQRHELIKGELTSMPPAGFEHGATIMKIGSPLHQHVETNSLGIVCGAETGFKISSDPDTVRAPDVAFVQRDRIPEGRLPKGYFPGAPDLAVEVISPNDTYSEVEEKVIDWLKAGARMVIVINPRARNVKVYSSPTEVIILAGSDQLMGGDVVPGFSCKVSELFD